MKKDARINYHDPLQGALTEITSAMSSICMEPKPVEGQPYGAYLIDVDEWAKHSYEHMEACFLLIAQLIDERKHEQVS